MQAAVRKKERATRKRIPRRLRTAVESRRCEGRLADIDVLLGGRRETPGAPAAATRLVNKRPPSHPRKWARARAASCTKPLGAADGRDAHALAFTSQKEAGGGRKKTRLFCKERSRASPPPSGGTSLPQQRVSGRRRRARARVDDPGVQTASELRGEERVRGKKDGICRDAQSKPAASKPPSIGQHREKRPARQRAGRRDAYVEQAAAQHHKT
ncbi:hypothetical protein HPB50_015401 [Hyalomma asiaticum]|uniref:Uncharacterized protein n=1 Tax=Hyalomma asiaticum TaxID=266040 RepID=A0ACB7TLC5_HYAAI|nr:hypothetical protein HPB50_015401 [Hyalomma asiaticum]